MLMKWYQFGVIIVIALQEVHHLRDSQGGVVIGDDQPSPVVLEVVLTEVSVQSKKKLVGITFFGSAQNLSLSFKQVVIFIAITI